MIKSIETLYEEEDNKLNPFATKHSETRKRVHSEDEHAYRLPLQRDRDRIYHSRYFKRLQYKTQVFTNTEGDNFRTRLTHTLEVSGIARSMASTLGLNSYLTECIALAHDIGHSPFGHAGQDILSKLMKEYGGFEHNKQSLRIVQILENRYIGFEGINLTTATLKGIMKHGGDYQESTLNKERNEEGPSLESLLTDVSDEIAYTCHDVEDGLEMGFISIEDLRDSELWTEHFSIVSEKNKDASLELKIRTTIRRILNSIVTDLQENIQKQIVLLQIQNKSEISGNGKSIITYSENMKDKLYALKNLLFNKLYKHPSVVTMSERGKSRIEKLFFHYQKNIHLIPDNFSKRLNQESESRVICDYISGMTDRFAILQSDSF
jgi:dGTPase